MQHIGRWVLVTLGGGQTYYGMLGIASGDRKKDVVLHRPMPYDPAAGTYEYSGNKAIFIREEELQSILVPLNEPELAAVGNRRGVYQLSTGARVNDQRQQREPRPSDESGAGQPGS